MRCQMTENDKKKEGFQEKIFKVSSSVSDSAVATSASSFTHLRQDGNSYYFTNTVPYHADYFFKVETISILPQMSKRTR